MTATETIAKLEDLVSLLDHDALRGHMKLGEALNFANSHLHQLNREMDAQQARLGQLHIWVAEARSAKVGFAEYISEKMEQAWKIEYR